MQGQDSELEVRKPGPPRGPRFPRGDVVAMTAWGQQSMPGALMASVGIGKGQTGWDSRGREGCSEESKLQLNLDDGQDTAGTRR